MKTSHTTYAAYRSYGHDPFAAWILSVPAEMFLGGAFVIGVVLGLVFG